MIRRAVLSLSIVLPALAGEPEGVEARVGTLSLRHPASWTAAVNSVTLAPGADLVALSLRSPHPDVRMVVMPCRLTRLDEASAAATADEMVALALGASPLEPGFLERVTLAHDTLETAGGPVPAGRVVLPARDGRPPETWHGITCVRKNGVGGRVFVIARAFTPVPGAVVNARAPSEAQGGPSADYLRALEQAYAIVRTVDHRP